MNIQKKADTRNQLTGGQYLKLRKENKAKMKTVISKPHKINKFIHKLQCELHKSACGSSDLNFSDVSSTSANSGNEKTTESDHREILVVANPDLITQCSSVYVMIDSRNQGKPNI